jgi:uncharacterized protein HemX
MQKVKLLLAAVAMAVAAYFFGKQKGKDNEKLRQYERESNNILAANRARGALSDDTARRRLRAKYDRG